ncbi:MAG: lipoyl(octanoyl) transferase LipB [Chloroflexota bacterium]|nr:MAG: lipoyl(octanoyl) transferase LipB [Chloroflexota bacterium]
MKRGGYEDRFSHPSPVTDRPDTDQARPNESSPFPPDRVAPCLQLHLGRVDYLAAWELQRLLVRACQAGDLSAALLLVEHPPTYTTGRLGKEKHLLRLPEELERLGAVFYRVDRGGDVTFHGPGQLVAYPILNLRRLGSDILTFVRGLEEAVIQTLADFGVSAGRSSGETGVWVGNEKIAAIGVHVSRWVSSHGLALNVSTDLSYFERIVPCGLHGRGVTSLERLLGHAVSISAVADLLATALAQQFELQMQPFEWRCKGIVLRRCLDREARLEHEAHERGHEKARKGEGGI